MCRAPEPAAVAAGVDMVRRHGRAFVTDGAGIRWVQTLIASHGATSRVDAPTRSVRHPRWRQEVHQPLALTSLPRNTRQGPSGAASPWKNAQPAQFLPATYVSWVARAASFL